MMRAAVYCRISRDPDRDGEQGRGVARQRADCVDLVDREGWELVDVYVDNDTSAYDGGPRPAWRRLLEACVEGRVDVVVAWRDDRLWRDVVEERQVSALLAEEGVQRIAFTSGRTYNPADVDDRLTSGLHALVAEHESAVKAVRVRRALEQRAAEGKHPGGPAPYGYRLPGGGEVATGRVPAGGMVVVEEEAAVVREVVRRTLAGEPLAGVARDLQARQVAGAAWSGTRLREMVDNPVYAGLLRFRGDVVGEGRWEPIISRAQHEAAAAMVDGRRTGSGAPATRLLTGFLRCYQCGEGMRGTTRRGTRRYKCRASAGCGGPSVSADPADGYVSGLLLTALADSQALADRLAASTSVDLSEVSERLTADERRLEELVADYYTGEVPKRAYLTARERLEGRIEDARATLAAAQSPSEPELPVGDRAALASWWEEAAASQRRTLLGVVVDRVDLQPWTPEMGRRFSPDRLHVVWA